MSEIIAAARRAIQVEAQAVKALENNLDDSFDTLVREISSCGGKVIVTGMGKSGIIGKKISATLSSTGSPSFFMHPAEAFHGNLGMVESSDIVLAISNSGETDEVLRLVPFFRENGNAIVSMTASSQSTLARNSKYNICIHVEAEACPLQLAPTSSTTATLVMGDALAIALMEASKFNKENFARFHPGGSLGKKLLLRAEHVMKHEDLPVIDESTKMPEIIHKITVGRLGLVIICQEEKIKGIITDGDMRRAFDTFQEKAFQLRAIDFMTEKPTCISLDERLIDIQTLMLEKKINSVLVTQEGDYESLRGVGQVYDIR
jgi:arabinose-5-phosphate isomerase